jgi:hypothetical protein
MKISNAIKKLEKAGFSASGANTGNRFSFTSRSGRDVVSFATNHGSDNLLFVKVRGANDHDDWQQDYSAGVYVDTISMAIRCAE